MVAATDAVIAIFELDRIINKKKHCNENAWKSTHTVTCRDGYIGS